MALHLLVPHGRYPCGKENWTSEAGWKGLHTQVPGVLFFCVSLGATKERRSPRQHDTATDEDGEGAVFALKHHLKVADR